MEWSRRLRAFVQRKHFEQELDGWHRVPSSWPAERDLDTFDLWFEWSFHSMVIDISHNPLLRKDF